MSNFKFRSSLIEKRADPWIYRHTDGKYYFTATVPAYDLIELRIADTIEALAEAEPIVVWRKHAPGDMSHLIWAPEIHFIAGKWYIYFAAAHTGESHPEHETYQHRMYVIEADDPCGLWQEKGQIRTHLDTFCLDASILQLNGRVYYIWAQKDGSIRGNSNIYIAEMDNPWTLKTDPVMLTRPEYDWECSVIPVNEGPAALVHDDRVFITYSANATGVEYCVGLLYADINSNLLDAASWTKVVEPVFASNPERQIYGPGHNGFTVAEDGQTPLIVYHARNKSNISGNPLDDPGRHTFVREIFFDDDGFPVFQ
jgi:GH43 family beta-xylosidase